jgi:hypothetical protein
MESKAMTRVGMDSSSCSSNTLKSLTNAHAIRGIATVKDVERFRKGHLTRYRESIVKFILNYLNYLKKQPILSKANSILTNYTGSETTTDSKNEYQESTYDEKTEITSIESEENYKRQPITVDKPCDSQIGAALQKVFSYLSFTLGILLLLLFLIQGHIYFFAVSIFLYQLY